MLTKKTKLTTRQVYLATQILLTRKSAEQDASYLYSTTCLLLSLGHLLKFQQCQYCRMWPERKAWLECELAKSQSNIYNAGRWDKLATSRAYRNGRSKSKSNAGLFWHPTQHQEGILEGGKQSGPWTNCVQNVPAVLK